MTPYQKFMQKDKPRLDAKIKTYYNSFKKFVCYDDLPDFKIEYTDSRINKDITYKAQVLPFEKPIILRYNIATLKENSDEFKETLVHEFTHIYDYCLLSKLYTDNFIRRNFFLYTEYHAVQLEVLFCYHIANDINEHVETMKNNLITKDVDIILDLPMKKWNLYKDKLFQYLKNKNQKTLHSLKESYMYALGAVSTLRHIIGGEFKIINFDDQFKDDMQQVFKLLSSIKYNKTPSEEILQQIGNLNAKMIIK